MTKTVLANIAPQDLSAVGGFLGQRFEANRVGRLKDWMLSEEFICEPRGYPRRVPGVYGVR